MQQRLRYTELETMEKCSKCLICAMYTCRMRCERATMVDLWVGSACLWVVASAYQHFASISRGNSLDGRTHSACRTSFMASWSCHRIIVSTM
jgi:hypothetical protein